MRDSVRYAFISFTSPLEGVVRWLYLDVKGLVTIAIGNLVDPIGAALALPLVRPDGTRATRDEIAAEWQLVKSHPEAARLGHRSLERATHLRLTDAGVDQVVGAKLTQMDIQLATRFREHSDCLQHPQLGWACGCGYETWPADAQLATLSMAWACGPAFRFPHLDACLRKRDFLGASYECGIDTRNNPGVVPRNAANRTLYRNAALVMSAGLDLDTLHWPKALTDERPTVPSVPNPPSEPPARDFEIVHRLPDSDDEDPGDRS